MESSVIEAVPIVCRSQAADWLVAPPDRLVKHRACGHACA
jgi:hypothetical protein